MADTMTPPDLPDTSGDYDAIVVGGGPAGLSAALVLGRCRRRVIVLDAGRPRNAAASALHGYLSRDGIAPSELLRIGRNELARYGVELRRAEVVDARPLEDGFEVTLFEGARLHGRKLLLATGVVDRVPRIEGIDALYGSTVVHCPYCDGWELRDRPLAVYGRGAAGTTLALALLTWSEDVVLCTDGPTRLRRSDVAALARHGVPVRGERIARLEGHGGQLEHIVFANGTRLERSGMFFTTGQVQRSDLPKRLGCALTEQGAFRTYRHEETDVPGVFVVGDASRDPQLVVIAAAEGAKAAFAINRSLQAIERGAIEAHPAELGERAAGT